MKIAGFDLRLKEKAMVLGLLPGATDYTRFIILGRSRVGSNFLQGLLNDHSQTTAYGELFQDEKQISWGLPVQSPSRRQLRLFQQEPARFLEQEVFKKYPKGTRAVGFKLFYYHARSNGHMALWEYLKEQEQLHVLHLKRTNILKTHLSWTLANATGKWIKLNDANGSSSQFPSKGSHQAAVTLEYEECLDVFTKTRRWETQFDDYFAGHPLLQIRYEELAHDHRAEMARVCAFLGLDSQEVRPSTRKQTRRPLSAAISNYFQLKEQFAGTEWEHFFEE